MLNRHSFIPAVLALLFSSSVFSACSDDSFADIESAAKENSTSNVSRQSISRANNPLSIEDYSDCFHMRNLSSLNGLHVFVKNNNPRYGDQSFLRLPYKRDFLRVESGLKDGNSFQIWVDQEAEGLYSFRLTSPIRGKHLRTSCKAPVSLIAVNPYPLEASQQWFLMPKHNGYAYIGSKAYVHRNPGPGGKPYVMDTSYDGVVFLDSNPSNPYQEFQLITEESIPVTKVDFDLEKAIIKELPQDKHIEKTFRYSNQDPFAVEKTVGGTFTVDETSNFDVNHDCIVYRLTLTDASPDIKLPTIKNADELIDDDNPVKHKIDGFQKLFHVEKIITYGRTYKIPRFTRCVLKAKFKTFSVQVPVMVYLQLNDHKFITKGIWKGTIVADPQYYQPTESIEWVKLPKQ